MTPRATWSASTRSADPRRNTSVVSALLRAIADALEAHRHRIVALADRETGLGATRLAGELTRTTYQLRFFTGVVEDGG